MTQPTPFGRFFLPGPTEVHPDVLQAQTRAMIGHRGPHITDLMQSIEPGLQDLFQTSRPVLVSTSSASGLMEAAVRNGVLGGRVLSLINGAFSSRFALLGISNVNAATKSEKFKVSGNCGMCEKRIEKAALGVVGVSKADWNKDTKEMVVDFDASKTSLDKIEVAIAKVGHDTPLQKADAKTYESLPACCKYERSAAK
jgi:copper chaperone CopZ